MPVRRVSASVLVCGFLVLTAFGVARMEVPEGLSASAEAWPVAGQNPRTWNRPISFGPYATSSVREGLEFSWSVEVFGVRGGPAKKPYRLVLDGPEGMAWEVECLSRALEVWKDGFSVELTDAFRPRLVCGFQEKGGAQPLRLVLGSDGRKLEGFVQLAGSAGAERKVLAVRSVHRLEGSRLPLEEPAGYVLEEGGRAVAAVERINRGRVWLDPALEPEARDRAAAVVAALLLYKPDLAPHDAP